MKQLNSIEHMFFDMESGGFSLDVSSLHFYDPSTAPRGKVSFQQIFKRFEAGLGAVPVLKRKLVTVPLNLDHPYWIEDADFDLANHLEHIELPAPGNWEQLMAVTSELFDRPIGRDKPLWFGAIITGINAVQDQAENSYAMFLKMHHAAVDGASGRAIQEAIHDLKPKGARKTAARSADGAPADRQPSGLSLLAKAYPNNLSKSLKTTGALARAVSGLARDIGQELRAKLQDKGESLGEREGGSPISLPETVLNPRDPGEGIHVDGRMFPLADIKAMRALHPGATVNDIVFAIVAGGIRRYLLDQDDLPDVPLTAGMPMDVRGESDTDATVMVTAVMSSLFTDIEDPVERIRASHEANSTGKDSLMVRGARPVMEVFENSPMLMISPLVRAVAWMAGKSNLIAMHTLITNVPGIPVPIYLAGGRMTAMMGMVPVAARTGVTHGVFSTPDTLAISMTCGSRVMADTTFYMDCLQASFDEYLELI